MKRLVLHLVLISSFLSAGFAQQATMAPPSAHAAQAQPSSADAIWADLMAGNRRFVSGKTKAVSVIPLRDGLAKGQQPKVAVLACSDSRVGPEIIFDKNLGDLFVVRSAGNIADAIGIGSLEYAVEHLGSTVLVVLGHTKCGAVGAACSGEKMPTANLQAIVDKISPAVTKVRPQSKGADDLLEKAVVENVQLSAHDVIASSPVLQHFLHDGKLTVFEAVYKLDSGEVVKLGEISGSSHE